jgi:hypothetical protein
MGHPALRWDGAHGYVFDAKRSQMRVTGVTVHGAELIN